MYMCKYNIRARNSTYIRSYAYHCFLLLMCYVTCFIWVSSLRSFFFLFYHACSVYVWESVHALRRLPSVTPVCTPVPETSGEWTTAFTRNYGVDSGSEPFRTPTHSRVTSIRAQFWISPPRTHRSSAVNWFWSRFEIPFTHSWFWTALALQALTGLPTVKHSRRFLISTPRPERGRRGWPRFEEGRCLEDRSGLGSWALLAGSPLRPSRLPLRGTA